MSLFQLTRRLSGAAANAEALRDIYIILPPRVDVKETDQKKTSGNKTKIGRYEINSACMIKNPP